MHLFQGYLIILKNQIYRYDYIRDDLFKIDKAIFDFFENKVISECLIIDVKNEGSINKFNINILNKLNLNVPLILFGGLGEKKKILNCFKFKNVNAIAIGNSLNYKENYLDLLKRSEIRKFFR